MNNVKHLVGISGSLRKESINTMLLKNVQQFLPATVSFDICSIADIPVYNGDDDLPETTTRPGAVNVFRQVLQGATGIIIASPEYNSSIPGGLKNAIDWASRGADSPLIGKPVSLMGATPGMWGTTRMQQAFLPVFNILKMPHLNKYEVYVAQALKKFDAAGNLTDDFTKELLKKHIDYFLATLGHQ